MNRATDTWGPTLRHVPAGSAKWRVLAVAAVACAVLCAAAADAGAAVIPARLRVEGRNGGAMSVLSEQVAAALPYQQSQSASQGAFAGTAAYDLDRSGFRVTFDQVRGGARHSFAQSYGVITFDVADDTAYTLSGQIAFDHLASAAGLVLLGAEIHDQTAGTSVYAQNSTDALVDGAMVLGSHDGERYVSGALTGTLSAGHRYQFVHRAVVQANQDDAGAGASGFVRLEIGQAVAELSVETIPEPSAAATALAVAGIVALRRRSRWTTITT